MRRTVAPFVLGLLFLFIGCGGNTIVGSWRITSELSDLPPGSKATLSFQQGDQCTMALDMAAGPGKLAFSLTGTYALKGNDLLIAFKEVKLDLTGYNEKQKGELQSLFENSKQRFLQNASATSGKLSWDSADKITIKGDDGITTLERVK
jgi:hypothetical protein